MNRIKQRVATYALIINENNEILVVKRAKHDTHPGLWELPGGTVDFGENPNVSVVREAKEETNLDIVMLRPLTIISHISQFGNHVVRIVYLCKMKKLDQKVMLSHEHSEYKWVTPDNAAIIKNSSFLEQIFKNLN